MDPFAADATLARPFATEADARLQRVRNELVSSDEQALRAVARAAGLHASRLDGSPLVYNRPDPYLPDLIVCRKELATELLSVCTPAPRYDS